MLKGLAHVCIGANDLAETERFYCGALGMRKVFEFTKAGSVTGFYLAVGKDTYVEVFQVAGLDPKAKSPIRHMCLETEDLDAVRCSLQKHGYGVTEKKLGADRSWQAWTTDPAGVRIEFHEYTENSSQRRGTTCVLG